MWLQTVWIILTYSYNAILVIFIATHLFVGAIISFLTGMYSGVYLSQNYEIPRINEPRSVWDKFISFLEKNRRNPQNVSVINILRPSTIRNFIVEPVPEPRPSSLIETISVPEQNEGASFTKTSSQTETMENDTDLGEDKSETTDTTLTAETTYNPLSENATTLILTEPEDLATDSKSFSSSQILEASLTLDKDSAISRSSSKLN